VTPALWTVVVHAGDSQLMLACQLLPDQLQPDLILLLHGQEPLRAPARTIGTTTGSMSGIEHDQILQHRSEDPPDVV